MVRVVYDYQVFYWQKYGGISRYIYELATRLFDACDLDVAVLAGAYVNEYLRQAKPGLVKGFPILQVSRSGKILSSFNRAFSSLWMQGNSTDIIHETFYSVNSLARKKSKTVLTIHDLIAEKFYPDSQVVQARAIAINRADHLICISENTKRDAIELLKVDPSKISVIYHGCSLGMDAGRPQPEIPIQGPYILYVGDRVSYKNFEQLLKAYAYSTYLKKDFRLVCFGGSPNFNGELTLAKNLGIAEGMLLRVAGDDALLESFYRGASAFIYPSIYEGFGIPLLEAMSLGCPVICSRASSFPEIVGEAAELFNPYDLDSLIDALEAVLYSSERSADLIARGKQRAAQFSWDRCAEETCKVYLSLV